MAVASGQCGGAATYFAPAERAPLTVLQADAATAQSNPLLQAITSCVDGLLMILNRQRQILAVNRPLLEALGLECAECLVGQRPGEALGCIHAAEGPGGCGTAKACRSCGAVLAILASQAEKRPCESECLATVHREGHTESLEFHVRATPVDAEGQPLTALLLSDISGEKRRVALERVFFHDILNTIGALTGWATLLRDGRGSSPERVASRIVRLSQHLEREVKEQRQLVDAERGILAVNVEEIPVANIVRELQVLFEAHTVAAGKHLLVEAADPEELLRTDAPLLLRVLTNMVKNAFEAIPEGESVRVRYERADPCRTFSVHNPGVIPEEVRYRIFSRSFSTSGVPGRGLGTYSMKLFGERYLGGEVGFESTPEEGTRFFIRLGPAGVGER